MLGLFHPELRAEAWVSPALVPEGWVGRDFVGEGSGGEEPPSEPNAVMWVSSSVRPGPGYVKLRRRQWWRVV